MEIDISDMLIIFDELLPLTDEEQKMYWFKFSRPDQITITFIISEFERNVNIIVRCNPSIVCTSIKLTHCRTIRVLEIENKTLEVIGGKEDYNNRCLISLLGDTIVAFEDSTF